MSEILKWRPVAGAVAVATGKPLKNIAENLPIIYKYADLFGYNSVNRVVAVLSTVAVEGPFAPVIEKGDKAYFDRIYGPLSKRPRADYVLDKNGLWLWRGRGIVQLTGEQNYINMGKIIGIDLHKDPDKALIPDVSARILFEYFKSRNLSLHADRGDWLQVRKQVNGGTTGWDYFAGPKGVVYRLQSLAFRG